MRRRLQFKFIIFSFILFLGLSVIAASSPARLVANNAGEPGDNLIGFGTSSVGGKTFNNTEITVDLPLDQMIWNIGSRVDGYGMCVTTSITQAAKYQGIDSYAGFRDWAANYGGGAYPEKVALQVAQYAKVRSIVEPAYLQYQGNNPSPILDLIDKTGRVACVAYGYSPRYGGAINHMVYCAHFGEKYACIVDNNQIGGVKGVEESRYEWMTREELVSRMKTQANQRNQAVPSDAWVFVWLDAPPTPTPFN